MENIKKDQETDIKEYPLACYIVGISLIVYLFIGAAIIITVHLKFHNIIHSDLLRSHIVCGAFGMFGAAIASIRKYYQYLISYSTNKVAGHTIQPMDWSLGWIYYYLTRPILGASLGALTYLLSFIGFHILADSVELNISQEGNFVLFAIAFVSGFSVSHVLDRVEAVAKQIFQADQKTNK